MVVPFTIYAGATIIYTNTMYTPGATENLQAFGVSDITRIMVTSTAWMASINFYG